LLALADGRADEAASMLSSTVDELRAHGRHYDVACVELELARALDEAGNQERAEQTRRRALAFLETLGCVNPY
jgi:uncharacterized protein HemY